jgi:hypothetical protein
VSYVSPLAHLRYVLVLNVLAALIPALGVKGRMHDPLLNARWWNHQYHSGVLVVSIAALVGSGLVYLLIRRKTVGWWVLPVRCLRWGFPWPLLHDCNA